MNKAPGIVPHTKFGLPYKWLAIGSVSVGTFMAVLDSTVVNIALPTITKALHTDIGTIQWVVTTYLLVIASTLLVFGRLADMYGRKQVYIFGFGVFSFGCLLCSLSQDVFQLIAFRAIQGVGAAMIMAIGPAIITSSFPPQERGKALGVMAMVVAAGATAGPTLGGLLVGVAGWRGAFYLQVPIGIIGTVTASFILNRDVVVAAVRKFDWLGAFTLGLALVAFLLGVGEGRERGWGSPLILALFFGALITGGMFIVTERRVASPLMDLNLFQNRLFVAANSTSLLSFMAMSSSTFLMPFYLQRTLGYSAAEAGLMLIPQPLMIAVVAPFSGRLSDRIGSRFLSSAGIALVCTGLLLNSTLDTQASYADVLMRLMVLGIGQGLFQSPNNSAIMGSVPREKLGFASSSLATMRNIGMSVGVAVSASVYGSRLIFHSAGQISTGADQAAANLNAFVPAFHDALYVAAAICSVGIVTSLVRGRHKAAVTTPRPAEPASLSLKSED